MTCIKINDNLPTRQLIIAANVHKVHTHFEQLYLQQFIITTLDSKV